MWGNLSRGNNNKKKNLLKNWYRKGMYYNVITIL